LFDFMVPDSAPRIKSAARDSPLFQDRGGSFFNRGQNVLGHKSSAAMSFYIAPMLLMELI
jgi:hypothetical protein